MKNPFVSIFLISSIFLLACNNSGHTNNKEETYVFRNYLEQTFHAKIPMEEHYFFLVPGSQCSGCNFYDALQIDSTLNERLTLITTFPSTNFQHFKHLWIDTSKNLSSLAFVNYTNKLIVTQAGKIQSISIVHDFFKQLDSLNRYYTK